MDIQSLHFFRSQTQPQHAGDYLIQKQKRSKIYTDNNFILKRVIHKQRLMPFSILEFDKVVGMRHSPCKGRRKVDLKNPRFQILIKENVKAI